MKLSGTIGRLLLALLLPAAIPGHAGESYSFDASEFARRPLELSGYVEYRHDRFQLGTGSTAYGLNYYGLPTRTELRRNTGIAKLEGRYTIDSMVFRARANIDAAHDDLGSDGNRRFDEFAAAWKPDPGFTLEAGKIAPKWGKGYAWNPVGFVERSKDPNDPELAREGYWMAMADWVRTFEGPLKTIALTPVIVPVGQDINRTFSPANRLQSGAKAYLLYHDTDIDFMFLNDGARLSRYGMDFSRNMGSNLEIHGEWARSRDVDRRIVSAGGAARTERGDAASWLVGMRYLTERELTIIAEYYRNGSGYSASEYRDFSQYAAAAIAQYQTTGVDTAVRRAASLVQGAYGRPQPMRSYVYLRASQKEPFDILYFSPSVTAIYNVEDRSYSVVPELLYTGYTNIELRARLFVLNGRRYTDFGEKQNTRRLELLARYYF